MMRLLRNLWYGRIWIHKFGPRKAPGTTKSANSTNTIPQWARRRRHLSFVFYIAVRRYDTWIKTGQLSPPPSDYQSNTGAGKPGQGHHPTSQQPFPLIDLSFVFFFFFFAYFIAAFFRQMDAWDGV